VVGAEVSGFHVQDIQFGASSATLVFDCEHGRPSSITMTVRRCTADDTSTAESALTGSAAVETNPNTTISAAAGASESDPTALTLTSATGASIDRTYLLTDDDTGVSEFLTIRSLNGSAAKATRPLKNNYTAGATFVSCRATQAFDTTWIASVNNLSSGHDANPTWRATIVATSGGVVRTYLRYFDLTRYPARHGVTPVDMDERFPGWLDDLPPDYQADQGRALIERAFRVFRADLYQDNKADQVLRNGEGVAELVMTRAMLLRLEDNALRGADNERALKVAKDVYTQRFNSLIRSPTMPVDLGGGGATQPIRRKSVWVL
jgi:hypothetical protein